MNWEAKLQQAGHPQVVSILLHTQEADNIWLQGEKQHATTLASLTTPYMNNIWTRCGVESMAGGIKLV